MKCMYKTGADFLKQIFNEIDNLFDILGIDGIFNSSF